MAAKIPMEGKARTVLIAALGMLVVGLGLGIWSWRRAADESQTPPPPSSTVAARAPVSETGTKRQSSQVYDDLLREGNAKAAADASKTGGSAMPVIRPDVERPPVQIPTTATPPPPTAKPVETQSSADDQAYRNALAERDRAIKERATAMAAQVQLLRKAWTVTGHTQMVAPEAPVEGSDVAAQAGANAGTGSGSASPRSGDRESITGAVSEATIARAGDTAVAVLDSPINTDNPLPMYRATVVQDGPLHGAVLLGQIQSNGSNRWSSGVPLTFTQISLPGMGMQPVSAFAINASDAGALKGEVNHHVWSRYAAAFGGAFLQGVGQGLLAGGRQQQVITSQTGYAVQSDAYTNKQLVLLGAANVGQMAATALQADVSRPPTISIPGGTTIAVFFTTDFPASSPR